MPDISRPVDFNTRAVAVNYFENARFHPSCWKVPYLYRYPGYKARFNHDISGRKLEVGYAKRPIWDLKQFPLDPLVFVPVDWRDEIEFVKKRASRATEWEQYEMGATRTRQAGYSWLFKNEEDYREFEVMTRRELVATTNFEIENRVNVATSRFRNICSIYERENPFAAPRESSGEFGQDSADSSDASSRLDLTDSTLSLGGPESHVYKRDWQAYTLWNGKPVINGEIVEWDKIPCARRVHESESDASFESDRYENFFIFLDRRQS